MNRCYRLVWNHVLQTTQVASEIVSSSSASPGNRARGRARRISPPRLARKAGQIAVVLSLTPVASSVWAATCSPGDPSACSAPGGAGVPGRTGNGGAGNGLGGGSSHLDGSGTTIPDAGSPGVGGDGGNGATGDSGLTAGGGTVGINLLNANSVGVNVPIAGGTGGTGADGLNFGSGGGGGGAAVYYSGPSISISTGVGLDGGDGGAGGNTSNAVSGNAGAGGGGGAAMVSTGNVATINVNGSLSGGDGGAGGTGGFGGGGGGGGDGLIVFGYSNVVTNVGTITGGAGGSGGVGNQANGGAGTGGAGVNLVGSNNLLLNAGTITGGSSTGGPAGAGVVTNGSAIISNAGTISGGLGNGTRGAAIRFGGVGNVLNLLAGSTLVGDLVVDAGASATISPVVTGLSLGNNVGLADAASTVKFDTSTAALNVTGVVSGLGSLTAQGGTLSTSATHTYTGATTIASGTLALTGNGSIAASSGLVNNGRFDISATTAGASINALTGTGAVELGARALTINNAGGTFSGVIGGSGDFLVAGGTQTLSGVSTYTGATSIGAGAALALAGPGSIAASSGVTNNGTLDISGTTAGASIATLAGTGVTTLGARTLTLTNAAGTYAGSISGTGGLTVNAGTQTLTGTHTYSGTTTLDGGTLRLTGNGSIATSWGLVNNGLFDISGTTAGASIKALTGTGAVALGSRTLTVSHGAGAFSGGMSGTGGLTVAGGTQILTGANAYTGTTTIDSGATLALAGAGSIAASNGVTNNGTLDISGTAAGVSVASLGGAGTVALGARTLTLTNAAGTFAGSMGGSGGLTLNGGTQILAGANTYTGATTINSGTLAVTGSLSAASNVVLGGNGAALDVSGAGAQSVAALTGAAGSRLQIGASTLTVSAASDSTFEGALAGTGVLAKQGPGTLTLNGTSGTFTGTTRVESGTLAVGDAEHATALLGGNVAVDAQGTLKGHGTVTGNVVNQGIVMPGGSVGTLTVGGKYSQASNATLTIEVNPTTSSLLGVGGSAVLNGGLSIVYAPGTYTARRYTLLSAANGVSGTFASVTSTAAAGADLGTLKPTVTYGANEVRLQLFATDATGAVIVSPTHTSIYTALGTAAVMRAQAVNAALLGRFVPSPNALPAARGAWIEATGSGTRLHAEGGQPGFTAHQYGFLAGTDRRVGDYTVGLAGGYAHTSIDEDTTGSSGATDTVRLALYGGRDFGPVTASATVGYGLDFLSQKRPFGSLGTAEGDHIGHELSAAGQAAVPMQLGGLTLTPAAGLRYAFFRGNSFNESGAAAQNLAVDADTARSLQPYVSLKLDKAFGDAVRPLNVQLRVGYARELMGTGRQITVLSQDGTLFAAPGVALSRDYVTGGASVSFRPSKATIVSLGYDGLINTGHASAQSGYARFDYQF